MFAMDATRQIPVDVADAMDAYPKLPAVIRATADVHANTRFALFATLPVLSGIALTATTARTDQLKEVYGFIICKSPFLFV
jgi:hypothetical protein